MDVTFVIAASALLQLLTALYAWRLVRLTGIRTAWVLIAAAFCLMALRRTVTLGRFLSGDLSAPPHLFDESVALGITLLMMGGVLWISPLFLTIKQASEALRQSRDELEVQVADRTRELHLTNEVLRQELSERRRAERQLAEYAANLARSNAELEQFAYVASHDLQEPLRMVAGFTQLLAKRYQGRLDAEADEFIGFAVDGAHRMQGLINDLLTFSRLGKRGKPLQDTDCNVVLEQALANLAAAIRESGAQVDAQPLPHALADEVLLGQLFQNLVANALKFHGREPPRVHISAAANGRDWTFAVRDNGIGIAPEYHQRIFAIFQRLHRRSEYPGTGIGLALCKKIVERHGGRIWVESQPGRGATFFFTLQGVEEHEQS